MAFRPRLLLLAALGVPLVAAAALHHAARPPVRPPHPAVVLVEAQPVPSLLATDGGVAANREPTERVEGVVVDPSGRPVAGARITLRDLDGEPVGVARADEAGRFTAHTGTTGQIFVLAQADERRGLVGPVDPAAPVRLVAAAPGRLSGVVVDGRGAPVEGAHVVAQPTRLEDQAAPGAGLGRLTRVEGRSAADGRFRLEIPTPDAWTVTVSHAGYLPATRTAFQMLGGARDLVLTLAGAPNAAEDPRAGDDGTEEKSGPAAGSSFSPDLWLRETPEGLVILAAPAGSPLLPGDVLVTVDGTPARSPSLWERLPGPKGTTVDVEALRPTTGQRIRARLARVEEIEEGC